MSKKLYLSDNGFTLMELLVVITILGLLTTIGVASYRNLTVNSRDAKRLTDLRILQSALEEYHSDQLHYPPEFDFTGPLVSPGTANIKTYLKTPPQDPNTNTTTPYLYEAQGTNCATATAASCTSYCVFTVMENAANILVDSTCTMKSGYNTSISTP